MAYYFSTTALWAEDNRHTCALTLYTGTPPGYPKPPANGLYEVDLSGHARRVIKLATPPAGNRSVTSCNIGQDEVTIATEIYGRSPGPKITDLTTYRLTNGKLIRQVSGTASAPCALPTVFSGDGRVAAETVGTGSAICNRATATAMGRMSGMALSLSWDGSLVLTVSSQGNATNYQVVQWRSGRVLWSATGLAQGGPSARLYAVAQQNGPALAVFPVGSQAPGDGLWLISPDHLPQHVAGGVEPVY
jgi:hypothetical protein